ncbi:MAG TPA: DUF2027 domain-containing protein [Dysgonamonadaceae bacterium]|nr:DUF2027 domain-containing protein [Dysgonamonadaceae bacterium]
MHKLKIGDTVRFLNSVGGGVVKGFQDKNIVIVEDEHGFDFPILATECVRVRTIEDEKLEKAKEEEEELIEDTERSPESPEISDETYEETPEGEKITTCLIYLPMDKKTLSSTNFECFFVNDSNYYLYFNYMSRENNAWQSRYSGLIEPNTKLFLEEFDKSEINELEKVCVQYVAFKHNKPYGFKSPVSVELRVDTVKFYKLHSFKENDYFEDDGLVYYITKRDIPEQEMLITTQDIQQTIREKEAPVGRPRRQRIGQKKGRKIKKGVKKEKDDILEINLHIEDLLDTTAGMSNKDMLDYQMSKFHETMDENKKNRNKRIVFIHGRGDGVLKNEITKAMKRQYKRSVFQDASFQEYGYGATMVIIK